MKRFILGYLILAAAMFGTAEWTIRNVRVTQHVTTPVEIVECDKPPISLREASQ